MASQFTSSGIYLSHTTSASGVPTAPDVGASTTGGSFNKTLPSSGTYNYVISEGKKAGQASGGTSMSSPYIAVRVS